MCKKDAQKQTQEYQQYYAAYAAQAQPETSAVPASTATATDVNTNGMEVDTAAPTVSGVNKRKADDDEVEKASKKPKIGMLTKQCLFVSSHALLAAPLKRDRENSTIFVGNLPVNSTEAELRQLFRDVRAFRSFNLANTKF
jgi:hypothetical protein